MEIKQMLTEINLVGKRTCGVAGLVIHSTGNTASARKEALNVHNNNQGGVGAHYFVDDDGIYQCVKDTNVIYHCGTAGCYTQKHKTFRNANTIGIEMCQKKSDGTVSSATIKNTAYLVQKLMKDHKLTDKEVVRHYDVVSKVCPCAYAGTTAKNKKWTELKKVLVGTTVKTEPTSTKTETDSSYKVKVTASALNVRSGAGTKYKVNTVVHKNEVYTIVAESNGWGKLKSGAGWICLKYTTKS